ncbi:hypothetical protein LC653_12430 [Nostoc sp. CHAB 5784]|nr:hypothetical protein [Nostoc mirabile CHAB5784]
MVCAPQWPSTTDSRCSRGVRRWSLGFKGDRYGTLPVSANQLLRVMELKQLAKKLGFSRIKPENKLHVVLETRRKGG